MKNSAGFTLVEIMIVAAIIALLAAIVIPNLIRNRLNANEAVAQAQLKTVAQACEAFRAVQTVPTYPEALSDMVDSTPSYLNSTIDTATTGIPKNGYFFEYVRLNSMQYICAARPQTYQVSGIRTFAVNESGMIRAANVGGEGIDTTAEYEDMSPLQ